MSKGQLGQFELLARLKTHRSNGILCTWDITSGQCRQQTMPESYVNASYLITFSPNLDWAAGINLYNEIRVWNCDTGTLIHDCYVPSLGLRTWDITYAIIFVQNLIIS